MSCFYKGVYLESPNLFVEDGVLLAGEDRQVVEIPEGWEILTSGKCRFGDRFLKGGDQFKTVLWENCTVGDSGTSASCFGMLIRRVRV